MNIVYIHAHDLGRYCEPMGYAIPAPNMMKLSKQGVLFRNAHSSAPSCAPSRAALTSGQYPHSCGMMGLPTTHLGYRFKNYKHHISNFFKDEGYITALAGVQHEAHLPFADPEKELGYMYYLDKNPNHHQGFQPDRTTGASIEFLQQTHDKPFFLSIGYLDPHRNNRNDNRTFIDAYDIEEPENIDADAAYCQPMPHLPDNPITRRETANFKMGVESLDKELGQLLNVLNSKYHKETTLVIFTTDHGPGFSEMKCTLSDRGTGVVLIVRGCEKSGFIPSGKANDALVQHMDLFPTLCELCGLDKPAWLQGKSLVPLLREDTTSIHSAIFTEQTYHGCPKVRPFRSVRTDRYRYTYCYKTDAPRGVDPGPAQEWLGNHGYFEKAHAEESLFDLYYDPHEANNIVGNPDYQEVLEQMRKKLKEWQEDTDDPIRHGDIPVPPVLAQK